MEGDRMPFEGGCTIVASLRQRRVQYCIRKSLDSAGRVERQAGEWTGDKESQTEGLKNQAEGKVEKVWGDVKDAANRAKDDVKTTNKREVEGENETRNRGEEEKEDEVA